jgi:pimeloyl-ACP methyl ester carboxylesterase
VGAVFLDIDPCPPPRQAEHLNEAGQAPPRRYASFERCVVAAAKSAAGASPVVHKHLAEHAYRLDGDEWVQRFDPGFLRAVRTWDNAALLSAIAVPALVLRGEQSTVMAPESFDMMLRLIPDARGALIEGAGHQLHIERPEAVAREIEAFVASIPAGGDTP